MTIPSVPRENFSTGTASGKRARDLGTVESTENVVTSFPRRWIECLIVLLLTAVIQFLLYGSSFLGSALLLPVQILKCPPLYEHPQSVAGSVPNYIRSDLILVGEPNRWLMASEYRAGRIPLWNPHAFAGTPFARAPIFSPFELLYVLWPSPRVLPWIQLLSACVGATGAWLVAVRLVKLSSLPAIVAGVTFPLSGFLMLWQGFDLTHSISVFPWELLAAVSLIERTTLLRMIGLALATSLELVSGQIDIAALVLLATGIAWIWHAIACVLVTRNVTTIVRPLVAVAVGWGLGVLLTAPMLLPLNEYLRTSARVASRSSGYEKRPPVGWKALPLVVFPEAYGTERDESIFVLMAKGNRFNQLESAAGAYCGAVAFLFAVPWAFQNRSRRGWVWCLTAIGIIGLSWQCDVPGMIPIWRLPGLRLLPANRFVFITAWAISLLASIGLEQLLAKQSLSRPWSISWGWIATFICIGGCLIGLAAWPAELNRLLPKPPRGLTIGGIKNQFAICYLHQLAWCLATAVCWGVAIVRPALRVKIARIAAVMIVVEPVCHFWNFYHQPRPSDYYPRLPVLEFIRNSPPGRTIGINGFPPRILESHDLNDIRGYDGVDPQAVVDVLKISADAEFDPNSYAQTASFSPLAVTKEGDETDIRLHPTTDMLGLRYLISPIPIRNAPFNDGVFSVLINSHTMPRVWVPTRVIERPTEQAVLSSLSPWEFKPAKQAYLTNRPVALPDECFGEVELKEQHPQRIVISANMRTSGLVVIGDRYDPGWKARVDGQEIDLLRVNYLLRGVFVPEGQHQIEMDYRPDAFRHGVRILQATTALLVILGCWSVFPRLTNRGRTRMKELNQKPSTTDPAAT